MNKPDSEIVEIIIKIVGDYFGLTEVQMFEKTRKREIVTPRQICHKLAWEYTSLSLEKVGLRIGNKDHGTVLHSSRKISDLIWSDKQIKRDYNKINEMVIYEKENDTPFIKMEIPLITHQINRVQ